MNWWENYCILIVIGCAIVAPLLVGSILDKQLWFQRARAWTLRKGPGLHYYLGSFITLLSIFLGGGVAALFFVMLDSLGIKLPGCQ
jgi:hypothetical protein